MTEKSALAAAFAAIDVHPAEPLARAKCRGLMRGYDARYGDDNSLRPIEVERMIVTPLWNPTTTARSRSFWLAGVIDVLTVRNDGRRTVLIDHKTTSQDIGDSQADFWRQLAVEAQPTHYMLLWWLCGRKIDEAIWDAVRKPGIAPRKLSKAERVHAVDSRTYYRDRLSNETLAALQLDDRETPEMFEARLANDCIQERPDWYFQRRVVPRLDEEILEHARDVWEWSQEILLARRNNRHGKNDGACLLYGTACRFLGICSGLDRPDSDRWSRKSQVHNELPDLVGDGRNVLTNSRLRCFKTCRRKHYYEYELGIVRRDERESDALAFGTLWHEAQRAWWTRKQEILYEHRNDAAGE